MRRRIMGLGLGLAIGIVGVGAIPASAFADSTCYTACTAGGGGAPPPSSPDPGTAKPVTASNGALAFTGADIEEMAAIGAGALLAGGLLVSYSRKRRTAAAS